MSDGSDPRLFHGQVPDWCICAPAFYERGRLDPQCRHDDIEYLLDDAEAREKRLTEALGELLADSDVAVNLLQSDTAPRANLIQSRQAARRLLPEDAA